jgi:hypothetical protein
MKKEGAGDSSKKRRKEGEGGVRKIIRLVITSNFYSPI